MEVSISERFPSLNPVEIRKTRASEIFLLIKRLGRKNRREAKNKNKNKILQEDLQETIGSRSSLFFVKKR